MVLANDRTPLPLANRSLLAQLSSGVDAMSSGTTTIDPTHGDLGHIYSRSYFIRRPELNHSPWLLHTATAGLHPLRIHLTNVAEDFESFDSTGVEGAPDPAWSVVTRLYQTLAEVTLLAERAGSLIDQLEALQDTRDAMDAEEGDAIVFGSPKRRVQAQSRVIGTRRGVPLIFPGDLME